MKFQNCILIHFERTHRRMEGRTDEPKAVRPFNFFNVGGIKKSINCIAGYGIINASV